MATIIWSDWFSVFSDLVPITIIRINKYSRRRVASEPILLAPADTRVVHTLGNAAAGLDNNKVKQELIKWCLGPDPTANNKDLPLLVNDR